MVKKNFMDFFHKTFSKLHEAGSVFKPKFSRKQLKKMLDLDISMPHIMVLKTISESKEPPKISEIGRKLSIPFAIMTRIIDRLQSKGLAKRINDPKDRRNYRIELTRKGNELSKKAHEIHMKHMMKVLDKLEENDRESFLKAVMTIITILSKYKEGVK